ncbi:MAG: hypothetical protein HZB40_08735 [Rhodocyclales bacterium]|nr:hypothetical protein [Rhodocyclales bacterium]
MTPSRPAALLRALGVVLIGLAGRALIDKLLALRGGAGLVAHWAQLTSLADVISGVTLAGIGVGLTGLVAAKSPSDQRRLLGEGLRLGLIVSGACLAACALLFAAGRLPMLPPALAWLALPALLTGWLTVAPGLLSFWLLGRGQPGRAMLLAGLVLAIPLAALALAASGRELATLLAAQAAIGLTLTLFILQRGGSWLAWRMPRHELRPFIYASLAIGIFSPLATAFARQRIGEAASWETAGAVQALWRSSEWITAIAAGLMQAHCLPRLAAARETLPFRRELRATARHVVAPALLALGLLWLLLPQALALLYRADLPVTRVDALPFLIGDALRMISWIFLFGLFARGAGRAVSLGEFLSLPLFALLLWLLPGTMTLPAVGLCWMLAYAAYCAFNALALRSCLQAGEGKSPG